MTGGCWLIVRKEGKKGRNEPKDVQEVHVLSTRNAQCSSTVREFHGRHGLSEVKRRCFSQGTEIPPADSKLKLISL